MRKISYSFLAAVILGGCSSDTGSSADGGDTQTMPMGGASATAMGSGGAAAANGNTNASPATCDGVLDANMNCLAYCDDQNPMCPDGSTCAPGKIPGENPGETKDIFYCKPGAATGGNADGGQTSEQPATGGMAGGSGMNGQPMSGGDGGMVVNPNPRPEPAEIMCNGEPLVLADSAGAGDYAPASRISKLDIPSDVDTAFEMGCNTVGANNGSGLSGLLTFTGDISSLTQADADGNYSLLLLLQLAGWNVGEAPGDNLKLNLFVGDTNPEGGFIIDLDSFEGRDPNNAPKLNFNAGVNECVMQSDSGNFELSLPLLPGLDLSFSLSEAKVKGKVSAAEKGFDMTQGTVTGYLTEEAVTNIVRAIKMACSGDSPPSLCSQAAALLGQPEEQLVSTIVTLIRGFDSRVTDNGVEGDCGDDCNAVSVCLVIESEAVNISGLSND